MCNLHIRNHKNTYLYICKEIKCIYIYNIPVTFTWIPNLAQCHQHTNFGSISICRKNPARDERLSRPTLCELSAEFSTFSWTATLNTAWQVYLNPCMQKLPTKSTKLPKLQNSCFCASSVVLKFFCFGREHTRTRQALSTSGSGFSQGPACQFTIFALV